MFRGGKIPETIKFDIDGREVTREEFVKCLIDMLKENKNKSKERTE